jgi:hypothetical protein
MTIRCEGFNTGTHSIAPVCGCSRALLAGLLLAWMSLWPGITTAQGTPLGIDPAFNGGYPLEDRFAGTSAANYAAQRIARLNNGDVVVAGIVPLAFGTTGRNLGLVRYSQSGERLAWTNPSETYVSFFNRYLTYPNNGVDNYVRVSGITVMGSRIYVQLDRAISVSDIDSQIVAFSDDGQFIGSYGAFTTGLREDGAGIVSYSYPTVPGLFARRLIAVATYIGANDRRIVTIKRFAIGGDGTLSVDTSFGPYGNGANDILFPDIACQAQTLCSGIATDVAIAGNDTISPRVYVAAYNRLDGVSDLRPAIVGINGATGSVLSNFGASGVFFPVGVGVTMFGAFPPRIAAELVDTEPGGSFDRVVLLSPFLFSGEGRGIVQRFKVGPPAGDGISYETFAQEPTPGTFVFGCCANMTSVALEGAFIAVAGDNGSAQYNPLILRIYDSGTSISSSWKEHPALRSNGTRWGNLTWYDVISTGNGDGSFLTTGQMGDDDSGTGKVQFSTLRYTPSPEFVFADGFE